MVTPLIESANLALHNVLKRPIGFDNLIHPAQSPDLNPMEGIWNSDEELKKVLQDEWSKMRCISDMPNRCRSLVESGGMPIKTRKYSI
jgi:hypothetical protein